MWLETKGGNTAAAVDSATEVAVDNRGFIRRLGRAVWWLLKSNDDRSANPSSGARAIKRIRII
jgi:hypothetical protein